MTKTQKAKKKKNTTTHLRESFDQELDLGLIKTCQELQKSMPLTKNFHGVQRFSNKDFSSLFRTRSIDRLFRLHVFFLLVTRVARHVPQEDIFVSSDVEVDLFFLSTFQLPHDRARWLFFSKELAFASENTLDHERNIKIGPFNSRTIVFLEFGFCPFVVYYYFFFSWVWGEQCGRVFIGFVLTLLLYALTTLCDSSTRRLL
jgi:hypothetical protein